MSARLALILGAAALAAGCATRTEYVTVALPLPPRPELPTIAAERLMCLSDAAYAAIVIRDRRLRQYAQQLAAMIRSTHDNGGAGDG